MGNACEAGSIRVISMDSENKIQTHNPIDYYMGAVVISNNTDKVKIDIRDDDDSKNIETWILKDNKLIKAQ
ncbi:TPA: hypothetical protein N5L55_003237 [Enterobacter roggenkampii]|nr:hypothetical protein [Enterobacter roggenkampii]HCM9320945.1 hypothetical protein [Enterobacter roggenkampii]